MSTPSISSTKGKSKFERITLYFELLKASDKKFDNARAVHAHLRECLTQIENEHNGLEARMTLFSFQDFRYHERLKIYYIDTTNQFVFIHAKGAYGIYQTDKNQHEIDFSFYAAGNNKIIEVPSSKGITLW